MTSPAYDIKEETPQRTAIDPVRTVDALRHGWTICNFVYGRDEITIERMVWSLFVEAAKVERSIPGVGGVGFPASWPEIWRSFGEVFEARRERLASGMPEYEQDRRSPKPTAAQISRYGEVILWLRFIHAKDKIQAMRVFWGRASGIPYPVLQKETGLSVSRLRNMRSEQLKTISRRLKQELSGAEMISAFHG